MALKTRYINKKDLDKMAQELEYLKNVTRKEITKRISSAREHGDLSENAEYAAAKEEQKLNDRKIGELEYALRFGVVYETTKSNFVILGSQVTLLVNNIKTVYHLVGFQDIDPSLGKISPESPIGKALMGKAVNDVFEIVLPQTVLQCKIIKID